MLFASGYPDNGSGGPIRVYSPGEVVPGLWESDGYPGTGWPDRDDGTGYNDYLDPMTLRYSVKDLDGNVGYADVNIQAAYGGCSGTGDQELTPDDVVEEDVSCITEGLIETRGKVTVRDGVVLYLSGSGVYLNGSFTDFFKVHAGAELIIR